MPVLQELLALRDPLRLNEAEVPVELKAVFDAFPKHHEKAFSKLWGGKRLVWHGERFFEDGDLGAAYKKAEEAAVAYINDGYNTDVNMEEDVSDIADMDDGDGQLDLHFDVEFGDQHGGERQECYLGYDPHKDKLYIGFDAWVSEDEFNSMFDSAFEEATGQSYDSDNEEHHNVFNNMWQEYQNEGYGFWGLVFEITNDHGEYTAEEATPALPGGFYKGVRKLFKSQHPNVIDLRLD
jgi:hypothetical protein